MSETFPPRQGSNEQASFEEDPLAELARIVAGDIDQPRSEPLEYRSEPVAAEPDSNELTFDLEAQMEQALLEDGFEPVHEGEVVSDAVEQTPFAGDSFEDDLISALQNEVDPAQEEPAAEEYQAPVAEDHSTIDVEAEQIAPTDVADGFEDALANELFENEEAFTDVPGAVDEGVSVHDDEPAAFEPNAILEPSSQDLVDEIVAEPVLIPDQTGATEEYYSASQTDEELSASFDDELTIADKSLEAEFGNAFEQELSSESDSLDGGWPHDDMHVSNEEFARAAAVDATLNSRDPQEVDPLIYQQENELQPSEQDFSYAEAEPRKTGSLRIAIASLALALIAGGAVAGYTWLGNGSSTGEPVVIKADTSPIKVKPDEPGGQQIANQDNASYGKVDGKDETVDQAELVSTTEEPANVAAAQTESAATAKTNERLSNKQTDTAVNGSGRAGNVRPRVVKTVRVRADGSIVADQTAAPIATPKIASIDGAKSSGKTAIPAASPIAKKPVVVASEPVVAKPVVVPAPAVTPAPAQKVVEVPTTTPSPAPVAKPAEVAAPVVQESEWVVQVSSVKSEEQARSTFKNLQSRFAALADRNMAVQRATVNGGTFYRVRVQTASKSDASALCSNLKAAGGSCFVTR